MNIELQHIISSIIKGLIITLQVSSNALIIGIVFGILFTIGTFSNNIIIRKITNIFIVIFRGLPELLVVLLLYFGSSIFIILDINALWSGIIALGLIYAAFASEIFKAAWKNIPKGQFEVCSVLVIPKLVIFINIIWPQIIRAALPGLGNLWLITLKDSSLVSLIGLIELMNIAQTTAIYTNKPFECFLVVGIIYLILTAISSIILNFLSSKYKLLGINNVL